MATRHKTAFNLKFGTLLEDGALPGLPGVYRFYDSKGELIYVGKAKNLRRRLGQYKNARRRKKSRKMRMIVAEAASYEYQVFPDHLSACLEETRLIQSRRPKLNVAGAYHFMYPMVGVKREGAEFFLAYTTDADKMPGFSFHGAFRSRHITKEAFYSLAELFGYVGHRAKKKIWAPKFSSVIMFRQIPSDWETLWNSFLSGQSASALETLVFALLENAGARKKSALIQDRLRNVRRFWREEIQPLTNARAYVPEQRYPVPQSERDALFLRHRLKDEVRVEL